MSKIVISVSGLEQVQTIVAKVKDWANSGYQITMTNAAINLAAKVSNDISQGREDENTPMAPLKDSTLQGPVRRDGNPTPREYYGNTPMKATGQLANDIVGVKVNDNVYEVRAYSAIGQAKLSSNAKSTHSGSPFAGDTPKVSRDPMKLSEGRMDAVEEQILKDIEKAIGV